MNLFICVYLIMLSITQTIYHRLICKVKKVKLSCICHAGSKRERKYSTYSLPTLALDGSEWSASHRGHAFTLYPSSIHWIGGWVGLRAGLDTEARGIIL
jgi:hypothetical protein